MKGSHSLPFNVGHYVELRSFIKGFRGAWFRCQIEKIAKRQHRLKYRDLNDGQTMKSVYHKAPWKPLGAEKDLMLRPEFPSICIQGEVPDLNKLSEVILVRNDAWKIGDLADWFCDGCYWSGTITEIRGNDKVEFTLHPPPLGEGFAYESFCKDLRPSLEWSQESGWTLPVPKGTPNYCPCARLIQPINQAKVKKDGKVDSQAAQESALELRTSAIPSSKRKLGNRGEKPKKAAQQSPDSTPSLPSVRKLRPRKKGPMNGTALAPQEERQDQGRMMDVDVPGKSSEKSCSDNVSSASARASAEAPGETLCIELPPDDEKSKRVRLSKSIPLNSSTCDSMESLFVDLEELLNRVKWMGRYLEPPESGIPGWKFQESPSQHS